MPTKSKYHLFSTSHHVVTFNASSFLRRIKWQLLFLLTTMHRFALPHQLVTLVLNWQRTQLHRLWNHKNRFNHRLAQDKRTRGETRSATQKHAYNSDFSRCRDQSTQVGPLLKSRQCSKITLSVTADFVHQLEAFSSCDSTMMTIGNLPNLNYRTMCSIDTTISTGPVTILETCPFFLLFVSFLHLIFVLLFFHTFLSLIFCLYTNRFCYVSLLPLL